MYNIKQKTEDLKIFDAKLVTHTSLSWSSSTQFFFLSFKSLEADLSLFFLAKVIK